MDNFQWFILAVFALIALGNAHVRYTRFKIIKTLQAKGWSADDISKVIKAYRED